MRRTGFMGLFLGIAIAIVAGLVGYNAGLTSAAASTGAAVVVTGGFPGIGTLFFLFLLAFLVFGVAGRKRGWAAGHGPWGHGWAAGAPGRDDPRRRWIADLHQSLHEEEARRDGEPGAR